LVERGEFYMSTLSRLVVIDATVTVEVRVAQAGARPHDAYGALFRQRARRPGYMDQVVIRHGRYRVRDRSEVVDQRHLLQPELLVECADVKYPAAVGHADRITDDWCCYRNCRVAWHR